MPSRYSGMIGKINRLDVLSRVAEVEGNGVKVDYPIVLFDGVCNLCNWWVQFIIKRDSRGLFRYAALQSRTGQRLLVEHGLRPQYLDTLLLIDGGSAFTKSDAILGIVSYLPGMWRLLGVFYFIPRLLRNQAYDLIAKNRYRWFGKHDACMVPTKDIAHRFLE